MFTDEQMRRLETIFLEAFELGLRHLDADDPLDWIAAFAYAIGWAKWEQNSDRIEKLDGLSARTWAVLDEATSP
jgi:hypothetical protein